MSIQPKRTSGSPCNLIDPPFCPPSSEIKPFETTSKDSQAGRIHENSYKVLKPSSEDGDRLIFDQTSKYMSMQIENASQSSSNQSASSFLHQLWEFAGQMLNCFSKESKSNAIDCTIPENALRVLGLSRKEAEDIHTLRERYQELCKAFNDRIEKSKTREPLRIQFEKILDKVHQSYNTLKNLCINEVVL